MMPPMTPPPPLTHHLVQTCLMRVTGVDASSVRMSPLSALLSRVAARQILRPALKKQPSPKVQLPQQDRQPAKQPQQQQPSPLLQLQTQRLPQPQQRPPPPQLQEQQQQQRPSALRQVTNTLPQGPATR